MSERPTTTASHPETSPHDGSLRGARVRIDLDALRHNYKVVSRVVEPARIGAVVKADAYGHDASQVTRALEASGCDTFFVALAEEGAELRQAGVTAEIIVLGVSRPAEFPLYRQFGLTGTLSALEQIEQWGNWCRDQDWRQAVHIKIDTGLTRLGLMPRELAAIWPQLEVSAEFSVEAFMTHLAASEDLASPRSDAQEALFHRTLEALPAAALEGCSLHIANSGAALSRDSSRYDVVRTGLALYGYDPTGRYSADLQRVMSLESQIVRVVEVPAGTPVGYGGEWVTERSSRIATVPVGYADGYPRSVGERAVALVRTRQVPVVGAVSMDMLTLDVTDAEARVGDEVVLVGQQGCSSFYADELATAAQTVTYDVLCRLGRQRLPRVILGAQGPGDGG